MESDNPGDETLSQLMEQVKTIAVVGLSSKAYRASHQVSAYMQKKGYRIIPVNPNESKVLGETSYPDLKSVPHKVDMVNVFRRSEHVSAVTQDAMNIGATSLWLQLGIRDDRAAGRARDSGMAVVQNKCLMIEHGRVAK